MKKLMFLVLMFLGSFAVAQPGPPSCNPWECPTDTYAQAIGFGTYGGDEVSVDDGETLYIPITRWLPSGRTTDFSCIGETDGATFSFNGDPDTSVEFSVSGITWNECTANLSFTLEVTFYNDDPVDYGYGTIYIDCAGTQCTVSGFYDFVDVEIGPMQ